MPATIPATAALGIKSLWSSLTLVAAGRIATLVAETVDEVSPPSEACEGTVVVASKPVNTPSELDKASWGTPWPGNNM